MKPLEEALTRTLSNTPEILTALDCAAVRGLNILSRADDRERHRICQSLSVLCALRILRVDGRGVDADALGLNNGANAGLERIEVVLGESIGLCNDGDEVDAGSKALHNLDVEWLEGVAGRTNEVEAGMHTQVGLVATLRLLLLAHISLVLVVNKVDNRGPRVAVVDIVAEAWRVNNGELDLEGLLLELGLDDVDL